MKPNFWIYSDQAEINRTAGSLIAFGAERFKRAKIINEIDHLKDIKYKIDNHIIHPKDTDIIEFIFEYVVDCVRFLIFFENYMKAKLIIQGYCVHCIDKTYPGFLELEKAQKKRPIKLKEIEDIEYFYVDEKNKIINHNAIKDKTIGISVLLGTEKYTSNYDFDSNIINFIHEVNKYRNQLHFHDNLYFNLSDKLIFNLEMINKFVDKTMNIK